MQALGLLLGQPRPGPGGARQVLLAAQLGGQRVQQPPAVLPREGLDAPASSLEGRDDLRPAPARPRAARGPAGVRPGRRAAAGPGPAAPAPLVELLLLHQHLGLQDPGPDVLGEPAAGRLQHVEGLRLLVLVPQQPGAQERRLGVAGRRRGRLGRSAARPRPTGAAPAAAGFRSISSVASGTGPAPAAPATSRRYSRSPRRCRPGRQRLDPVQPGRQVLRVGAARPAASPPAELGLAQLGIAPRQQHVDQRLQGRDPRHLRLQGVRICLRLDEFMLIEMIIWPSNTG